MRSRRKREKTTCLKKGKTNFGSAFFFVSLFGAKSTIFIDCTWQFPK